MVENEQVEHEQAEKKTNQGTKYRLFLLVFLPFLLGFIGFLWFGPRNVLLYGILLLDRPEDKKVLYESSLFNDDSIPDGVKVYVLAGEKYPRGVIYREIHSLQGFGKSVVVEGLDTEKDMGLVTSFLFDTHVARVQDGFEVTILQARTWERREAGKLYYYRRNERRRQSYVVKQNWLTVGVLEGVSATNTSTSRSTKPLELKHKDFDSQ